jgi:phospholipid transport system transporter-binding protein
VPTDVARDGATLRFDGPLERPVVASLWPRALALLAGTERFDLGAVDRIDSAGMALLAALAARAGGAVRVEGAPAGLDDLRAAYRLDGHLRPAA